MEILIGREPENSRLMVQAEGKVGYIGQPGCVPNTVSRRDHCKLTVSSDGTMSIANNKPGNVTYVDGQQVMMKRVLLSSSVELGESKYGIDLKTVMDVVNKMCPPPPVVYSLRPLERVWDQYEKDQIEIQRQERYKSQRKASANQIKSLLPLVGTLFITVEALSWVRYVLVGASVLLTILMMVRNNAASNGDSDDKMLAEKLLERRHQFEKEYVCPNPDCRAFKGNMPYVQLKNIKTCTACQCKYSS